MDRNIAKVLLENLIARIVISPETGQGTISGVLTPMEIEALKIAESLLTVNDEIDAIFESESKADQIATTREPEETKEDTTSELLRLLQPKDEMVADSKTETEPISEPVFVQQPEKIRVKLNLDSLNFTSPQDEETRMCLDFGTAMSKAFATVVDEGEIFDTLPLRLGDRASGGKSKDIYPVPSSLWIGNDGKIYVGQAAIAQSLQAGSGVKRRRFDSLKKELILGLKESSPFQQPMHESLNPTDVVLSTGEAITFYLGYLTDLACTELQERHSCSRYVLRNFALPSWEPERRAWGEKMLKEMLVKSQIVADTFHGRWGDGISAKEVKAVLEKIKGLEKLPEYLVSEGITEPLAVGSSRLRQEEPSRGLIMVVDVGAGTSDLALFVVAEDPARNIFNAFPIKNGNQSLHIAGDALDKALLQIILQKSRSDKNDNDYHYVLQRLTMQIRTLKEDLFRDDFCVASLASGERLQIEIDEFLNHSSVENFKKSIAEKFKDVLKSMNKNIALRFADGGVSVVLTGGGAKLPMVEALAKGMDYIHGVQITRNVVPLVPEIFSSDKELSDVYPQLAVAIGGTMPHLIDEKSAIDDISISKGEATLSRSQVTGI
jgi:molecular chaperone HscA